MEIKDSYVLDLELLVFGTIFFPSGYVDSFSFKGEGLKKKLLSGS